MLDWLWGIIVSIVTFVASMFGFELKKKSVRFADEVTSEEAAQSEANEPSTDTSDTTQ